MARLAAVRRLLRPAALAATAGASGCSRTEEAAPPRVLITGFHDWRELENNIWRCRDNPSCRLLLGPPCTAPPLVRDGPLPRALSAAAVPADFCYVTLPVLWSVSAALEPSTSLRHACLCILPLHPLAHPDVAGSALATADTASGLDLGAFEIVIHLGLGVYDSHNTILLERDAYNMCRGQDALAHFPPGPGLEDGAPQIQECSTSLAAQHAMVARDSALPGGFSVRVALARSANSYICNATHWRALKAERELPRSRRPRAAYFVHLPYASEDDADHAALARAVAVLVGRIVEAERCSRTASSSSGRAGT